MRITWAQALGWRMRRQLLDPVGVRSAVEVAHALADGRLIKTWAMRGALHLLTPEEGGAFLSMLAAGRSWELPSAQRHFGMQTKHWERMRRVVREALAGSPLTREELIAAIVTEAN